MSEYLPVLNSLLNQFQLPFLSFQRVLSIHSHLSVQHELMFNLICCNSPHSETVFWFLWNLNADGGTASKAVNTGGLVQAPYD